MENTISDPVAELLLAILAGLELPESSDRYHHIEERAIEGSPHHAEFLSAASADAALGRLFPDIDEQFGIARHHRPRTLAHKLLDTAAWNVWLEQRSGRDAIVKEVMSALATMRRACLDEAVTMTAISGMAFGVPEGTRIETPLGVLSSVTDKHRRIIGTLSSEIQTPPFASVLERPIKVGVDVVPNGRFKGDRMPGAAESGARDLALAAILAAGADNFDTTIDFFITRTSPISGGIPGGGYRTAPIGGPMLNAGAVERLRDWTEVLARRPISEIATERMLAISNNTIEHVYAFIDCVIIWENLFGTGDNQELAFRVALNMAMVLSDDPNERMALFKEIKLLYAKRSKIVHGGLHLAGWDALEIRRRTWTLSITALQRLLTVHPHLVGASTDDFVRLAFE